MKKWKLLLHTDSAFSKDIIQYFLGEHVIYGLSNFGRHSFSALVYYLLLIHIFYSSMSKKQKPLVCNKTTIHFAKCCVGYPGKALLQLNIQLHILDYLKFYLHTTHSQIQNASPLVTSARFSTSRIARLDLDILAPISDFVVSFLLFKKDFLERITYLRIAFEAQRLPRRSIVMKIAIEESMIRWTMFITKSPKIVLW